MTFVESRRHLLGAGLAGLGMSLPLFALRGSEGARNSQGIFNVRDFGATANGRTLDTKALQSAIDAATASGGMVYFPPGIYLSGTLFLKSNMTLHFEAGATLLGSTRLTDYPSVRPKIRSYTDTYVNRSLIYAENAENVSLTGRGVLNGQGGQFIKRVYLVRPYLIRMVNCRNVHVANLTLVESPMWVQHYLACENLCITGLTVHSRCNTNNDGIDIDACQRVRISDCEISSGDDSIVLKSTANLPCCDVTVSNCVVSSLCNGLKLGTESVGGFENIVFTNCTVYDTDLSGIALETVDGGILENVEVSNIVMRNTKSAIFLRLGNRARPIYEGAPKPGVGSFRNVVIENVQANGANKVGCPITGLPSHPIENVTLANIRIQFAGGGSLADATRQIPENETRYPEYDMLGTLPAYGFYCRHAKNLQFLETQLDCEQVDMRPAIVSDDVERLKLAGFEALNSNPLIVLRNNRDAWLADNQAPRGNKVWLRVEDGRTENIRIVNSDLRGSGTPVERGPDVASGKLLVGTRLHPY